MNVFPIYNILVVPDANIYIKTETYEKVTGRSAVAEDKLVIVVAKEDLKREEFTSDSFYPIGLRATIAEVNSNGFIMLRTANRVNIDDVAVYRDHTIDLTISRRNDINDLDPEEARRKLYSVKTAMMKFSESFQWGQAARGFIAQWNSIGEAAVVMSPWMLSSNSERYAVLAEDSVAKRTELLEKLIYENLEMNKVNREAEHAQEEDHQKIYRESAIRKQMEYLQRELDEMNPENVTDIRKLEIKIEESGMNETARKEADKVLSRLKHEGQGAESALLYDYLDFLAGLPWKKEKPKDISLDEAAKVLDEEHYGLKKVKERIIQQIAVMSLKRQQSGSILLFVGAPGTGKTSIGQSIAKALQREYVRVSLGGARDEADIRGHRRTYIGAMPGRIMDGISKSGVSNPVMVLDEVDKLYGSYNGDPASALLEVLDPEQNSTFTDHYLNVPYDLSNVLFICTANTLDSIPEQDVVPGGPIAKTEAHPAGDAFQATVALFFHLRVDLLPFLRPFHGIEFQVTAVFFAKFLRRHPVDIYIILKPGDLCLDILHGQALTLLIGFFQPCQFSAQHPQHQAGNVIFREQVHGSLACQGLSKRAFFRIVQRFQTGKDLFRQGQVLVDLLIHPPPDSQSESHGWPGS